MIRDSLARFAEASTARTKANKEYKLALSDLLNDLGMEKYQNMLSAEAAVKLSKIHSDVKLYSDEDYAFSVRINAPEVHLDFSALRNSLINQQISKTVIDAVFRDGWVSKPPSKSYTISLK